MFHHRGIFIEHTDRILSMPVCTQLLNFIWYAERSFHLVETGLPLPAGTGSFSSSPFHSIEKLPHMTYFLVGGCGKLAQLSRMHCTCRAFVHLHEVENPLLEVVKYANLHCMEEVRLREVAHNTGNMLKYVETSVNMTR